MRVAIFGDVHGCIEELTELLNHPDIKSCDTIYSLGDLTDKGPESNACVELCADRNVILVNSNHDDKYIEFIKKNRNPESIKNDDRRKIYESLSTKSKDYLLTAKAYVKDNLGDFKFLLVHGGVGPLHKIEGRLDGQTFNDILRLRYVDQNSFQKVSTIHNEDGTWGPEHPNVFGWREIYDGRYGVVFHGHIAECQDVIVYPTIKIFHQNDSNILSRFPYNVVSLDTGCVYGWNLSAAILDSNKDTMEIVQIKGKNAYCSKNR